MAEFAVIDAAVAALGAGGLAPAPTLLGEVEPDRQADLPAVVVSLVDVRQAGSGLGGRTRLVEDGVLPLHAVIDLADPVLAEVPGVVLWDAPSRTLTLPHGGLVRIDRGVGALRPVDFTLRVGGVGWALVDAPPVGDEVRVEPRVGQAVLGRDPGAVSVEVDYHLGAWEQQVRRLEGRLQVDVLDNALGGLRTLSRGAVEALSTRAAGLGFLSLGVQSLGAVGAVEQPSQGRRQRIVFSFVYEHLIDRPSSGGIISRIPLTTRISSATVDATGGVAEHVTTEEGVGVLAPDLGE